MSYKICFTMGEKKSFFENVFMFVPSGVITAEFINDPGCIHGSQVSEWGGLYKKLGGFYDQFGGKVGVNSTFDMS